MELQRQLDEASDRESANRQENLRLQRLADQLHMQKKDLDHQRFDLETFGGDASEETRAELRERYVRVKLNVEVGNLKCMGIMLITIPYLDIYVRRYVHVNS